MTFLANDTAISVVLARMGLIISRSIAIYSMTAKGVPMPRDINGVSRQLRCFVASDLGTITDRRAPIHLSIYES